MRTGTPDQEGSREQLYDALVTALVDAHESNELGEDELDRRIDAMLWADIATLKVLARQWNLLIPKKTS